jgi:hypothetical protein
MLTIRKEQMAVFEAHFDRQFRAGLLRHVRTDLPTESKAMSDGDVDGMITQAIERGRPYGVTSERDVALFLDLMLLKGRDFDRDPKLRWMGNILKDKDLEGAAKMNAIYHRLAALENRQPPSTQPR